MAVYSTIHHVEVEIPTDVYERYGHTKSYEHHSCNASSLVPHSGQDAYSSVYEWGESSDREDCERFAAYWEKVIAEWQKVC